MMKKALVLLLFLMLFLGVGEGVRADECKFLDRGAEQVAGTFVQEKYIQELPFPVRSSGEFSYRKNKLLIWEILQPIQATIKIFQDRIVQRDSTGDEQVSSVVEMPRLSLLVGVFYGLLNGDLEVLNEHFNVEQNATPGDDCRLILKPKTSQLNLVLQNVVLEKQESKLIFTLQESAGNRQLITFDDLVFTQELDVD